MSAPLIQVQHLIKRFGTKNILNDLQFEAGAGEFVILLGPNGAGKTTFLRIMASLVRPTFGTVSIAGCSLPAQSVMARRLVGMVSHQPLLYGNLTAAENLRFYGRLYGIAGLEERVQATLRTAGLHKRQAEKVQTFSRGMQQRLAIGRALLHDPQILLMDEPYTGLDQEACATLDNLLEQVAARGCTVLMATHDLAHAVSLPTRFDVLAQGRIRASIPRAGLPAAGLAAFYQQALQS